MKGSGSHDVRKTVTALFCDLAGSTSMGERFDSETMRQIMARYYDEMRAAIERHGGRVEKFIGDAVVAVFGIPVLREDDALRAVRAAAGIRETLDRLNAELEKRWGARLDVRIGVNTGEVVAGDAAEPESFVVGDVMNVAARLEQAAKPGQVLLGKWTHLLVADLVDAEAVEPLSLKGKSERVPAFRLIGLRGGGSGERARTNAPLCGRRHELGLIEHAFSATVEEERCRVMTVTGPAGIGKSRLVEEFTDSVRGKTTVLRGRCLPYGDGITYWPLAEALRPAAGIVEHDSPQTALEKITALLPPQSDVESSAERVGAALGVSDIACEPEEIFAAVQRLLEALAGTRPVVIVFDDLHWAKPTFVDLIRWLGERAAATPIFVLCTARPELLEAHPEWDRNAGAFELATLERLSEPEMYLLLENLLGPKSLPESVTERLAAWAEGNPLFLEETLRMLIEEGILERDDKDWDAVSEHEATSAPPSIQAVIEARLDRLEAGERTVLGAASVIGREFSVEAVQALCPEISPLALESQFGAMAAKQFVAPFSEALPGERGYSFAHLLIRDVTYTTLLKAQRADFHERFANWLEQGTQERLSEYRGILGYHLEQAHSYRRDLGRADTNADELAGRAAEHLEKAGRRALAMGDMPAAASLLERALLLIPEGKPRSDLALKLGIVLTEVGETARAQALLRDRIELEQPHTVRAEEAEASSPHSMPLPRALATHGRTPFVGRSVELERLGELSSKTAGGERQLVFLVGEPGIGKTRLAAEVCTSAYEAGAIVLLGRCDEETVVPFQPFVEALRHHITHCVPDQLMDQLGSSGGDLARLVPELTEHLPGLPEPFRGRPETERYRLFDAVVSLLTQLSRDRLAVLVLDDLHWADKPTLLLLRHLARAPEQSRLLVLGTYREAELSRTHPLYETVADLRREDLFELIQLQGLSEDEVGSLVGGWSGQEPPRDFIRAIFGETEGNPFFIAEMLRHLVESGAIYQRDGRWTSDLTAEQMGIPEGVKEVIGRRLSRLSDDANQALSMASVIGRTFEIDVLEQLGDISGDRLLEALEDALSARLIREQPDTEGGFTFAHALVRETLYEELSSVRRGRLHRRIGAVLEALRGSNLEPYLPQLAHHFLIGAPGADLDKAIEYGRRAGNQAVEQLAYEEAVVHYDRALGALQKGKPDEQLQCELLLSLGEAQNGAGEVSDAKARFDEAARLSRALVAPEQLARAALGYGGGLGGFGSFIKRSDDGLVLLLKEAIDALGPQDGILRALLLGRLAVALYHTSQVGARRDAAQEAKEIATRLGDPLAQLVALNAYHGSSWDPGAADNRLADSTEILRLASELGHAEMRFQGHVLRLAAAFELRDMEVVDEQIEACAGLAGELRQPLYRWQTTVFRAARCIMEGRFEEGEALAQEAFSLGQPINSDVALAVFGAQMFYVRWAQGRLDELDPEAIRTIAEQNPEVPGWRTALAFLYVELDKEPETRSELERVAVNDFEDLPRDGNWLVSTNLLSWACAYLGDSNRAETLYELVLPYSHLGIVAAPGVQCQGAVSGTLGRLATTMCRWEEASRHLEDAAERHLSMGNRPLAAWTLCEHAEMLVSKGDPADREKTRALVNEAAETARELGMKGLESRAERVRIGLKEPATARR